MTTKTERPVHYRVSFVSHCACGVLDRFGVRETRRVEDVTCRSCLREVRKPAQTLDQAFNRVREYLMRQHPDERATVERGLVATLNDLVEDTKEIQ